MSGKRAKALRREFQALHGRAPLKARIEYRQTVKATKPAHATVRTPSGRINRIAERFLRPIFSVTAIQPSEWRRAKRGYVPPISAETRAAQKLFRDGRIEDNNRRIVDSRLHRNQAYGKTKRAGIFATGRGL